MPPAIEKMNADHVGIHVLVQVSCVITHFMNCSSQIGRDQLVCDSNSIVLNLWQSSVNAWPLVKL